MSDAYSAYGLTVQLPFTCRLLPKAPSGIIPDIIVREGTVPKCLTDLLAEGHNWQMERDRFLLLGGRRGGRFLVESGNAITLERNPAAEDERLEVQFMATVLAVLLQQRGMLVLHANCALTHRGAIAVCGESGSGKTTTVAGLLREGARLLSDDITVLRHGCSGIAEVVPGPGMLHLCEDTAAHFGYDISGLPRYPWRRMKAAFPARSIMADTSGPLHAIYHLTLGDTQDLAIERLCGSAKFVVLQDCLYGPGKPEDNHTARSLLLNLLGHVDVVRITRPRTGWSLEDIVRSILDG